MRNGRAAPVGVFLVFIAVTVMLAAASTVHCIELPSPSSAFRWMLFLTCLAN